MYTISLFVRHKRPWNENLDHILEWLSSIMVHCVRLYCIQTEGWCKLQSGLLKFTYFSCISLDSFKNCYTYQAPGAEGHSSENVYALVARVKGR